MARPLTLADSPQVLAEALRRKCHEHMSQTVTERPSDQLAASVLAGLEECEKLIKDENDLIRRHEITADYTPEDAHGEGYEVGSCEVALTVILALARPFIERGELEA